MNIIGRVTRDAQVRDLSNEKKVVNFSIATNESYRNKNGERVDRATFFDCSYFLSPNVAKALLKGTLVELGGRVSATAWMDKQGQPKAGLNFIATHIKLHGKANTHIQDTREIEVYEAVEISNKDVQSNGSGRDDLPF